MFVFEDLFSEDYFKKVRAFVELGWLAKREDVLPVLRHIVLEDCEDEWRLRALEVLGNWEAVEELPVLKPLLFNNNPIVVRGMMWFIVTVGAAKDILEMLDFAASPKGRIIRAETVLDLVTLAVQKRRITVAEIESFAKDNLRVQRYISGWDFSDETPRLLTVYPSADYFALCCKERDIPFKQYKRLHYRNYKP